jgi:hypothetical protein
MRINQSITNNNKQCPRFGTRVSISGMGDLNTNLRVVEAIKRQFDKIKRDNPNLTTKIIEQNTDTIHFLTGDEACLAVAIRTIPLYFDDSNTNQTLYTTLDNALSDLVGAPVKEFRA